MSERRPDDLDRSDATFPSVERLELLSLSSLTDWINVSSCVASGATIAFIILSTSLDDNFCSCNWDCRLSSTSLADSAERCASSISTNRRVGVLFPSDMTNFLIDEEKSSVLVILVNLIEGTEVKKRQGTIYKSQNYVVKDELIGAIFGWCILPVPGNRLVCPAFRLLIKYKYIWSRDRDMTCWLVYTNTDFDIAL